MWPFRDTRKTISVSEFFICTLLVIVTYIWSIICCLSSSVLERRPSLYSVDKQYMFVVTSHLLAEYVILYIAAVSTAWSLVGSPRNGQAAFTPLSTTFTVFGVHSWLQNCGRF
jgi:hypothetical protein